MVIRKPRRTQPQGAGVRAIEGVAWSAGSGYLTAGVGVGGLYASPAAATSVGSAPFAKGKTFTVVIVLCMPAASQALTEVLRIGGGSDGWRLDVSTSSGGIDLFRWTANGVANLTTDIWNVSQFSTSVFVAVASFGASDAALFAGPSGAGAGYAELVKTRTASVSMIAPSDQRIQIKGGAAKIYGVAVLPSRVCETRAREIILNPWQLFAPVVLPAGEYAASGGGTAYNVSVAESVTLADADAGIAAFSSARAEALTLADAPVGAATLGVARIESVSLADAAAGAWSTPAALAEAMSLADATDATTGPNVYDVAVAEALSLADSSTGEFPFQAPQFTGADAWPRKRDTLREDVLEAIEALAPSKKIEREAKQAFKRAVDAPQAPSIGPALAQAITGASERIQALVAQAITQAQAQRRRARRRKQQQQLLLM